MSKRRHIDVQFRGETHRINTREAAELNRRGFLRRCGTRYSVKDEPFLNVMNPAPRGQETHHGK